MMNTVSAIPDFASLTEVILLPDDAIAWATNRGQTMTDRHEQWHSYLRSLAVIGVKQWLEAGVTSYIIQLDEQQPPDSSMVLQVNGLRVGVVPVGSVPPETVQLPQASVEGRLAMHLWILVEVHEELGQVRIVQALENQSICTQANARNANSDYLVPLIAFNQSPDRTLFYLSHLAQTVAQTSSEQTPPLAASTPVTAIGNQVMNVGRWLQDQLDEVARQFAWTLLDPLTPAVALRSPTQELETILTEIDPQGVTIPARARAAYTEVQVAGLPLRLYALIWNVFETATPEWSLLVFLGASPGDLLPSGLTLRIGDADSVLAQQTFFAASDATFLYAQVFGTWDESFTVTILPPDDGAPLTLPAFGFQPNL